MPILTAQERLGSLVAGRYRVQRVLATGGMSVLFEARDERARRAVALKLLRAEDCVEDRKRARFLQEMRLTAELRHPHVVDVLDLGEDEDSAPFLVMELMHGRSLQAELDERGTLGFEQALSLILPIMEALSAVHAAGVVHRDVKPDNIFLQHGARRAIIPKLLDFGIAKTEETTFTTRTGAVLGTPHYMAPEQLVSAVVGPTADVWAIAAVLYRMLSGQAPFHADNPAEVIAKLTRDPAPPLHVEGLAPSICTTIDRALSRDPSDRYPDMHAFAMALVLCARESGFAVAHEPATPPAAFAARFVPERTLTAPSQSIVVPPRGRWTPWLTGGLAALTLIAVIATWPSTPAPSAEVKPQAAAAPPAAAVATATTAPVVAPAEPEVVTPIEVVAPAPERPKPPPRERRKPPSAARQPEAPAPSRFAQPKEPGALPVAVQW